MPARSVYTPSRWKLWQPSLRMWLPLSLLLLLFVGLVVFVDCIAPSREMADVRGVTTHHGSGMVLAISYIPPSKSGVNPSVLVSLLVAGETVTFRTQADLHENEPVQVTYRVGKSGRIHMDAIEPHRAGRKGKTMTITLELAPDVESGPSETARRQGKTPEQIAGETLRASFAVSSTQYPTARQLLAMPEAGRDRILSEAAAHAAPLYEADLALPLEQRELTTISAIEDDVYDRYGQTHVQSAVPSRVVENHSLGQVSFGQRTRSHRSWHRPKPVSPSAGRFSQRVVFNHSPCSSP